MFDEVFVDYFLVVVGWLVGLGVRRGIEFVMDGGDKLFVLSGFVFVEEGV